MAPRVSAVLLVLLFVAFPAASAATPPAPQQVGPAAQVTPDEPPVRENTTFHIQLRPDGDARWTVTNTFALEDGNDTQAFETLGEDFTSGGTDNNLADQFRNASAAASSTTDRQMRITDVNRNYAIDGDRGRLVLSFTWTNFASVNGSRLEVRDGFYTSGGTWLNGLNESQSLVISPPQGYALTTSPQDSYLQDGNLRIDGPETFQRGDLTIVYSGDQSPPPGPGDLPLWAVGGILVVIALAVAVRYLNDRDGVPAAGTNGTDSDSGGDAPVAPEATNGGSEPGIDVELLSDEERVERLLDQNGGRMKQARIVKETGWSNAKVSQLLSSMDDDDRIDKLRIGRENLISFPDEDVTEIED
jgi:hypothetical protein